MIVRTAGGARLTLGEPLARGGEATVHRVQGQGGLVAKLYTRPREGAADKLRHMLAHPPVDPTRALGHASIAWPRDLLLDGGGRLIGFTMPLITDAVSLLEVFNPRRRAKVLPGFDRRYLHRTARNLASALGALHAASTVVGDLNEGNVLVTPRTLVTLIDADSFQVEERRGGAIVIHPCPVGRAEYTAPELQGQAFADSWRRPEHDAFGLAVLVFQLLMNGSHPYRGQWLGAGDPPGVEDKIARGLFPWSGAADLAPPAGAPPLDSLHPELVELLLRCFVDGQQRPGLRPGAEAWAEALGVAEEHLAACPNGHWFSDHLRRCPECGGRGRGPAPLARRPTQRAAGRQPAAPAAAMAVGTGFLRGLAGLGALPGRILGGGFRALAGGLGLAASAPRAWATSLRWTAGLALISLAAAFGLSGLLAAAHAALLSWLDPLAVAGDGGPAALWALTAGALGSGLGAGLRRVGRRPGEALGWPELTAFAESAASALFGWLGGWAAAALIWMFATGASWPASILGSGVAGPAAASPAWILAWSVYGGAIAALGPGHEAAQPPRAPLGWAAVAAVFAAIGWLAARVGAGW